MPVFYWLMAALMPRVGVVVLPGCCLYGFLMLRVPGCVVCGVLIALYGEFDPGSGRTLAACLTHASRTLKLGACTWWMSGERVSNTGVTCPFLWDKRWKRCLILDSQALLHGEVRKDFSVRHGLAAYELVGGAVAYQGDDG